VRREHGSMWYYRVRKCGEKYAFDLAICITLFGCPGCVFCVCDHNICCSDSEINCGGTCCPIDQECCLGQCCGPGVECTSSGCCPSGQSVCGTTCCPNDQACCNGECCGPGIQCDTGTGGCGCPSGQTAHVIQSSGSRFGAASVQTTAAVVCCPAGQEPCGDSGACCAPEKCDASGQCNTCSAGQTECNGTCVDECASPKVLNPTTCQCECPQGQTTCGTQCCASNQTCNNGTCQDVCPQGTACGSGGTCCPPGYTCCGGGFNGECCPIGNGNNCVDCPQGPRCSPLGGPPPCP
jgi:hypothetical protein